MLRVLSRLCALLFFLAMAGMGGLSWLLYRYGQDLPDYNRLADYEPPTETRVHAGDGRLMAEFAAERRVFVPIEVMSKRVLHAFLAAEDKNFYDHRGIDFFGIARAALTNFQHLHSDRRPVGASTITQQVAKNFLLTNEVSVTRKVKEAILAIRIEQALSKDRILELYLNQIFLGNRSYGVAAAALNYFNKSLDELTIAEAAYLAALPKAPNNYNPERQMEAALIRRNWVIGRMAEDGYITASEAGLATAAPLEMRRRDHTEQVSADYYAEEVRRELAKLFGDKQLYEGGLSVRTPLDPRLQDIATRALRAGLINYDRHHGWRGPVVHPSGQDNWQHILTGIAVPKGGEAWRLAIVLDTKTTDKGSDRASDGATIGFSNGSKGLIPFSEVKWARPQRDEGRVGPEPRRVADVLKVGDVVMVELVPVVVAAESAPEKPTLAKPTPDKPTLAKIGAAKIGAAKIGAVKVGAAKPLPAKVGAARETVLPVFALRQIPEVQGGLVAIDPHTGRVLAMSGGFSPSMSQFNRATQAMRQPGSAFKPFVYLTALDNGFTPSSLVLDAPFAHDPGFGQPIWRPENYHQKFYGPTPLRVGIEKSRNLMTVRLADKIGMGKVKATVEKFGIIDNFQPYLPMALGAGETTVLRLTTAYAMLVNGGKRITPTFIDRVQDRKGKTIYRHDDRPCEDCTGLVWKATMEAPTVPDTREQIEDPRTCYQIVNIMTGVVQRGTASRLAALGRPLGGKTGTTNDSNDVWFVGFTPDLVVGLYVGFDQPRTLGDKETGGSTAVPIFEHLIAEALKDKPAIPFRAPPGLQFVRVNPETGRPAEPGAKKAILETFLPGTAPNEADNTVLGESSGSSEFPGDGDTINPDSDPSLAVDGGMETYPTGTPRPYGQRPAAATGPGSGPGGTDSGGLY
ncbi:MAG: penicillin-binding protein 1A [Rhodospirillaceae bacterium]